MTIASVTYRRPDNTFVAVLDNGWPYHVIQSDPLYPLAQTMGAAAPFEPVPESPTAEEALAAWRATVTKDRGLLCLAMFGGGLLSGPSALAAARGEWPTEFDPFLAGRSTQEQLSMQIAWADAPVVRYQNPLLQGAALAYCAGDPAAAVLLLDNLFGAP